MRGLLGLLARSASARPGRALPRGPCSPSGGHHHLFVSSPSPTAPRSHPAVPTAGGLSFGRLFRSWRPHRDPSGSPGLLGLPPARGALPSSWERKLMVVCGAVRSAARSGALVDRGFNWMAFSLQKRGGFRMDNYYRRWNSWPSWMPTADGVIIGLIGVNVAVFILWKVANPRFMMENFTIKSQKNR
ncbi:hypothetical protein Taro_002298 [Colocasia esculenta]|uniref:Uncharacterized protein n=1 Tax=Colocasia esculenta TaxID=4460 RepID=A0A843TKF2_COLES|nr:hypothetical protein [Colocasia esculenta]